VEEARDLLKSWGVPELPPLPLPGEGEGDYDWEAEDEPKDKKKKKRKSRARPEPASASSGPVKKSKPENLLDEELTELFAGLAGDTDDKKKEPKTDAIGAKLQALKDKFAGKPAEKRHRARQTRVRRRKRKKGCAQCCSAVQQTKARSQRREPFRWKAMALRLWRRRSWWPFAAKRVL
jgi:hypothetical protein